MSSAAAELAVIEQSEDEIASGWLALQCQMLPTVQRAAVYLRSTDPDLEAAAAVWPTGSGAAPHLSSIASTVRKKECPVVHGSNQRPGSRRAATLLVGCPIRREEELHGVVVVEVAGEGEQQQRAVMRLLQWGVAWFDFIDAESSRGHSDAMATVVGTLASGLETSGFQAAATMVATELTTNLLCSRVSIGLRRRNNVRVCAVSNSVRFRKNTNLIRDLEGAMNEAVDQQSTVLYPVPKDRLTLVTAAHEKHARAHDMMSVCTVPLYKEGRLLGAITFERDNPRPFDAATADICEVAASLIGPVLELKRRDERSALGRAGEEMLRGVTRVLGPRHLLLKLVTLVVVAAITWASTETTVYRVTGKAAIEGRVQRAVVAPMEGYIATANARPGDTVADGEILGRMDDRELRFEMTGLIGEREQMLKEYRGALASRDRAESRILSEKIVQAEARLQLIQERLSRTEFVAPFDGVVVSGDLSHRLGSPVERGEVLFEIAPLDSYRVIVQVPEQDISTIEVGQPGHIALAAAPGEPLPLVIEKITPVSTPAEGRNYFRVEASLNAPTEYLRPGMQGFGKIDIGERKLIWALTHNMLNWLRLWTWSWWPWS